MLKLLPVICLIALVMNVAATPEMGKTRYSSNKSKSANGNINNLNGNDSGTARKGAAQQSSLQLPSLALPAYPYYGPGTVIVQEPTYARVGEIVQKVPTAVSHQSQTVVHNHANLVTPIVAPAVRTQVLHAYNAPYVFSASYLARPQAHHQKN